MIPSQNIEELSQTFEEVLQLSGEQQLLEKIVFESERFISKEINLELHVIDLSDQFFTLYKNSNKDIHFTIGKVLRRAAHMVYRKTLAHHPKKKRNLKRFLNLIK